jgi:hypothetical protein
MGSLIWIGLAVCFVVAVVLSGRAPRGGKPVAHTALMKNARGILIIGVVVSGAMGLWGALRH